MHYDLVPGINYGFTPSAAPDGVDPQKHFTQGMYAYINSRHDENLRKQSEKIFGQTAPFSGSNDDSLLIGRAVASHTGYRSDPARYMKEKNMPLPPNWSGENSQLYALIGQDFVQKAQEEYNNSDARKKAIAEQEAKTLESLQQNMTSLLKNHPGTIENAIIKAEDVTDINSWVEISELVPEMDKKKLASSMQKASFAYNLIKDDKRTHISRRDMAYLLHFLGDWETENGERVYKQDYIATQFFKAALASKSQRAAKDVGLLDSALNALMTPGRGVAQALDEGLKIYDSFQSDESQLGKDAIALRDSGKYDAMLLDIQYTINQANAATTQPGEEASFWQQVRAAVGSSAGSTVHFFSGAFGAGTFLVGHTNLNRIAAEAEGAANPWLEGAIDTGIDFAAEKIAFGAAGKLAMSSRIADAAIRKFGISKVTPAFLGRIQANAIGRGALNVAAGTLEELTVETAASQIYQGGVRGGLRFLGVDVEQYAYKEGGEIKTTNPFWGAFLSVCDTMTDPVAVSSTVIFVASLTVGQKAEVYRQSAALTKDVEALQLMGLSKEDAESISKDPSFKSRQNRVQQALIRDVMANTDEVKGRVQKAQQERLERMEAAIMARSGVLEFGLKQANIIKHTPTDNGNYLVTVPKTEEELAAEREGKDAEAAAAIPTEKEVEMTADELTSFATTIVDNEVLHHLRNLQSRVMGAAAVRASKSESDVRKDIYNAAELNSRAVNIMQRNGNVIDLNVLTALAEEAAESVSGWQKQGMSAEQAAAQPSVIPGVSLGALMNAPQDFVKEAQDKKLDPNATKTNIFNLPGRTPAHSVMLMVSGEVEAKEALEDLIENDIRNDIGSNPDLLNKLADALKAVDAEMQQLDPDHVALFPDGEVDYQRVVEAFSKLASADFALNHNLLPLSEMAHSAIDYAVTKLSDLQKLQNLANAFKAAVSAGRVDSSALESILEKTRANMGDIFSAPFNQGFQDAMQDVSAAESLRDKYAEGDLSTPQPFPETPASDSVIDQPIPSAMQEQAPQVDQESGEYTAPDAAPVSQDVSVGKGFVNEACTVEYDGSMRGSVQTVQLNPHPDASNFSRTDAWNPMSAPVHVARREDGTMLTVSGQPNAQDTYTSVHVFDVVPETEHDWVAEHSAGQNILNRTATAQDIETFFEYNPMTRAEAEIAGMVVKDSQGRPHPQYSSSFVLPTKQSTYALSPLTPEARESFSVARRTKEFHSVLVTAKREASRYASTFRNAGRNNKLAIVEAGRLSGILQGIAKRIPIPFRPKGMTELVRVHNILARMLHDGKLSRSSKLDKAFMEALRAEIASAPGIATEEVQAQLEEALKNPQDPTRLRVEEKLRKELYAKVARQHLDAINKVSTDPSSAPKRKAYERMSESGFIPESMVQEVYEAVFDDVYNELQSLGGGKLTDEQKQSIRKTVAERVRKDAYRQAAKNLADKLAAKNFRITPESRAMLYAYERMAKSGVITEALADDVWESIFNDVAAQEKLGGAEFTEEQKQAIRDKVTQEVTADAYKQSAKMLADKMIGKDYQWPAASLKRKRALEKAIESGRPNQDLTPDDITASLYNAKATELDKRTAMKQYAKRELAELNAIQADKERAHRKDKERIMRALHTIIKTGSVPKNTALNAAEQKQLAEIAEDMLTDATIEQRSSQQIERQGAAFVKQLKDKLLKDYAKSYAKSQVSQIKEQHRKEESEFNKQRTRALQAMHRVVQLGFIPADSTLDSTQQAELSALAESEQTEAVIDQRTATAVRNQEYAAIKKLEKQLLTKHAKTYAKKQLKDIQLLATYEKRYRVDEKENLIHGFARVMADGRISENSSLPPAAQASLSLAVEEEMAAALPDALAKELKATLPQLNRELVQDIIKRHTGQQLGKVLTSIVDEVANSIDAAYKAHYLARMQRILNTLKPSKNKHHLAPGKLSADDYEHIQRLVAYSNLEMDEYNKAKEELEAKIQELANTEGKQDELDAAKIEYTELSVFGALKDRTVGEVVNAVESLFDIVSTGKAAWAEKLEAQAARIRAAQYAVKSGVGKVDPAAIADKELKTASFFGSARLALSLKNFYSIPQFLDWISHIPGMKGIAESWRNAHAKATQVVRRLELDDIAAEKAFWKSIGINSDLQQAKFFEKALERKKTGILTADKTERRRISISKETAQKWLDMSPEQREAERNRLRTEGAKPNTIVEEEAIPLIEGQLGATEGKINISYTHTLPNTSYELVADKMVLLNLVLMAERPAFTQHMAEVGFDADTIAKIRNYLGDKVCQYGDFMRKYLQNTGMREVHEERTGIRLPEDLFYWPGNFDQSSRADDAISALESQLALQGRYNFLKELKEHNLDPSLVLGAHQVFRVALSQHRHYIHFGHISSDIRRMIHDKDTALALKTYMGIAGFNAFKSHIDTLDGVPAVQANLTRGLNMLIGTALALRAAVLLPANIGTLIKNLSSVFNAARGSDMSLAQELVQILKGRFLPNNKLPISFGEMWNSDAIQTRFRNASYYEAIRKMNSDGKFSTIGIVPRMLFKTIEAFDAFGNTVGAQALYNHTYEQEIKANEQRINNGAQPLTESEIHQVCQQAVQNMLDIAGQPLSPSQTSAFAARDRGALSRALVFMGSEGINKLTNADLAAIHKGADASFISRMFARAQYLAPYSTFEQFVVMGIALAVGNAPIDDDDEAWKWWVGNALAGISGAGLLQSYPLVGDAFSNLVRVATGSKSFMPTGMLGELTGTDYESLGKIIDDTAIIGKAIADSISGTKDKKSKSDSELTWTIIQNLRRLAVLGSYFSGYSRIGTTLGDTLVAANAVGNAVRYPVQAWKNSEKDNKKKKKKKRAKLNLKSLAK